jgi:hypothetical protein
LRKGASYREGPRLVAVGKWKKMWLHVVYGWCRSCREEFTSRWHITFRPRGYERYAQLRERYPGALERLRSRATACHICNQHFSLDQPPHLDHVIALSRGGPNDPSNLALAHKVCNSRKHRSRFNPMTGQGWLL